MTFRINPCTHLPHLHTHTLLPQHLLNQCWWYRNDSQFTGALSGEETGIQTDSCFCLLLGLLLGNCWMEDTMGALWLGISTRTSWRRVETSFKRSRGVGQKENAGKEAMEAERRACFAAMKRCLAVVQLEECNRPKADGTQMILFRIQHQGLRWNIASHELFSMEDRAQQGD